MTDEGFKRNLATILNADFEDNNRFMDYYGEAAVAH